jgi:hypothetical protein
VWLQTGLGLVNRFNCHLQAVATNNYNTIAISTLYTSLEHTVKSSQSVTRHFLVMAPTMAIPVSCSSPPIQKWLSSNLVPCLHLGTDHTENKALLFLHLCLLLQECAFRTVAQKWPWYIRPSHGRCITTALNATMLYNKRYLIRTILLLALLHVKRD